MTDALSISDALASLAAARSLKDQLTAAARMIYARRNGGAVMRRRVDLQSVMRSWSVVDEAVRAEHLAMLDALPSAKSGMNPPAGAVFIDWTEADFPHGYDPWQVFAWDSAGREWAALIAACTTEGDMPPPYPMAPVARAWLDHDATLERGTITATRATGNQGRMVKQPVAASILARTTWQDGGSVEGVMVDGEPLSARISDLADTFERKKRRPKRRKTLLKVPSSQGELMPSLPRGVRSVAPDLRMTALEGLEGSLAGDTHTVMTWAYALDRPLILTETQGAALLARTEAGEYRRPQESDRQRFRASTAVLRTSLIYDPNDPFPGADWRELADIQRTFDGLYWLGPGRWTRASAGTQWILTAQGSQATTRYRLAGRQSLAGRIVAGIEYRLYARFDGKPGPGPDVRPGGGEKSGAGDPVFVNWIECLVLAGDWFDTANESQTRAAYRRWERAASALAKHGYFLPGRKGSDGRQHANLGGSAPTGDTVEIVARPRGGRGINTHRRAGLLVRASARYTEATRLAHLPHGEGFEQVRLLDYTGRPVDAGDSEDDTPTGE